MGFLENDQEFIGAIREAKLWFTAHFLRKIFVTLFFTNSMNRPEQVWQQTWEILSKDILYHERNFFNMKVTLFFKFIFESGV
jgi:hypothetical protein